MPAASRQPDATPGVMDALTRRSRRTASNPTVKDVAAHAGVAISTASAALREDKRCYASAETRARVLQAARELGYRANRFASALRGKRSYTLGLLFESLQMSSVNLFKLAPIERLAWDAGYRVIVGNYGDSPRRHREHLQEFLANRLDGIILASSMADNADLVQEIVYQGVPVVAIDSIYDFPLPNVWFDRTEAARLQVDHMLRTGHNRLVFFASTEPSGLALQKMDGYVQGLAEHGMTLADHRVVDLPVLLGERLFSYGREAIARLLDEGETFDGVIASDSLAVGAIQALQAAGRRVPQDVAVIGFDDEDYASSVSPALTTVRHPRTAGEKALTLLLEQIQARDAGAETENRQIRLAPELIVRGSAPAVGPYG